MIKSKVTARFVAYESIGNSSIPMDSVTKEWFVFGRRVFVQYIGIMPSRDVKWIYPSANFL
jgi:hypothetical protein